MKKLFILLAILYMSVSCCYESRLNSLNSRIEALEQAGYQAQLDALEASIASLESVEAEIEKAIITIQTVDKDEQEQVEYLKDADGRLESQIVSLQELLEQESSDTEDWVEKTFSTLEQYDVVVEDLTELNEFVLNEVNDINTTITSNYSALSKEITDAKTSIEAWVETTLETYCTESEVDTKISVLQTELESLQADLNVLGKRVAKLEEEVGKLTKEFSITFSEDEMEILLVESKSIDYVITGATDSTTVNVFAQNGWSAKVTPTTAGSGSITITAPDYQAEEKIVVLVYDGAYRSIVCSIQVISVTASNLSSDLVKGTANSYIVSNAGYYKFKTVKGNSNESVGMVASVEVLWETFGNDVTPNVGDLISEVSYKNDYITFRTNKTYKEGNALIAAKDDNGTILWSWHIWFTDKPKDQVYNNNAGTMMDRNLGATSATPGDVGALGLLYQWGRKDPFLGSSTIFSGPPAASTITWPESVTSDVSNGTIEYAQENPITFIKTNSKNSDWYYTGTKERDTTRWQSEKTIYDPCPVGYRVPDGDSTGIWATAFSASGDDWDIANGGTMIIHSWDERNYGYHFGTTEDGSNYLTMEECWYPASGYLSMYGNLNYRGDVSTKGYYWSCSSFSKYGSYSGCRTLYLNFNYTGRVFPVSGGTPADGYSVRCQKEE